MTCGSINPVGLPDEPQRHPNHPYPSHEPTIPVSLGVGIFLPSPDADPHFESRWNNTVGIHLPAHLNENPVLIWVPNRNRPNSQPSPVQAPPTHPRSRSAPNPPSALKIPVLWTNSERVHQVHLNEKPVLISVPNRKLTHSQPRPGRPPPAYRRSRSIPQYRPILSKF